MGIVDGVTIPLTASCYPSSPVAVMMTKEDQQYVINQKENCLPVPRPNGGVRIINTNATVEFKKE